MKLPCEALVYRSLIMLMSSKCRQIVVRFWFGEIAQRKLCYDLGLKYGEID